MDRNVTCIDKLSRSPRGGSIGVPVHEDYCIRQDLPKPRITRHCNKNPCPYRWLSADWSEVLAMATMFYLYVNLLKVVKVNDTSSFGFLQINYSV